MWSSFFLKNLGPGGCLFGFPFINPQNRGPLPQREKKKTHSHMRLCMGATTTSGFPWEFPKHPLPAYLGRSNGDMTCTKLGLFWPTQEVRPQKGCPQEREKNKIVFGFGVETVSAANNFFWPVSASTNSQILRCCLEALAWDKEALELSPVFSVHPTFGEPPKPSVQFSFKGWTNRFPLALP